MAPSPPSRCRGVLVLHQVKSDHKYFNYYEFTTYYFLKYYFSRLWLSSNKHKYYLFEPHEIYLAIFQHQTLQAKREYLAALHNQMSEREQKKDMLKQDFKEDRKIVETEREVQQNRIRQLQERKLQQLKYAFKNINTSFYHHFFLFLKFTELTMYRTSTSKTSRGNVKCLTRPASPIPILA